MLSFLENVMKAFQQADFHHMNFFMMAGQLNIPGFRIAGFNPGKFLRPGCFSDI